MPEHDRFLMLYCDDASCRVNTFEAGDDGTCPGCGEVGHRLDTHEPYDEE